MWSLIIEETVVNNEYAKSNENRRMLSYTEAVREAIVQMMEINESVYAMGQGINDPVGYWGITTGLHTKFGVQRVFDVPLAENGMMGMAIGSAIGGMRPISFHNRPDFLLLSLDQLLNHASKYNYMSGGQCSIPIVVWATTGKGWGSAAQHSQAIQAIFMHFPGIKVVMPTTPYDAKGLMISAIMDNNPIVILEHRSLLNQKGFVPAESYRIEIGKGVIRKFGGDVTIIGISEMINHALEASVILQSRGISAEVIDLRSISPWDEEIVMESVKKTGRLLIADTGWRTGGVSAEIAATVYEKGFGYLKNSIIRMGCLDVPTPASYSLEEVFYKSSDDIVVAVENLLRHEA